MHMRATEALADLVRTGSESALKRVRVRVRVKERETVPYGWLIPNPKTSQTIQMNFGHLLPSTLLNNLLPST